MINNWGKNCLKTNRPQTLYNFRQEVCSSLGLLYPVALHDLTITVDTDIPGAARLGLAIEHGGVCNVVVLKHALLEPTLRSEVLLKRDTEREEAGIYIVRQNTTRKKNPQLHLSLFLLKHECSGPLRTARKGTDFTKRERKH